MNLYITLFLAISLNWKLYVYDKIMAYQVPIVIVSEGRAIFEHVKLDLYTEWTS